MARVRRAFMLLLAVGLAAPLSLVLVLRWVPPPTTAFMLRDALAAPDAGGSGRAPYRWTGWDGIAPHAALAVIASEDQKFPDHNGFDVEAIRMALGAALQGERLRGALPAGAQRSQQQPGEHESGSGPHAVVPLGAYFCYGYRRIFCDWRASISCGF